MIPYIELNAIGRSLICFWIILLILAYVLHLVLSLRQRRYRQAITVLMVIICLLFLMQICYSISVWKMGGVLLAEAERPGRLPAVGYLLILAGFSFAAVVLFRMNTVYARTHIAPAAIKEAVDQNPTGICYYRENGQLVLTNYRMKELAFAVSGRALLNGAEFYEVIRDRHIVKLGDGTVVRFSHRLFTLDREDIHELLADDITELYRKTEALQKKNEMMRQQNRRMREYSETIDENVRRQEILSTKTNIHKEMNRLLLSTEKAIHSENQEEKQKILENWQKNILLLCMEADSGARNNTLSDLEALAKVVGITIHYDQQPDTQDTAALQLFSMAAAEAMVNAVKHGGADELYVQVTENEEQLTAAFTDNGTGAPEAITEGGGLRSLRQRVEASGGIMRIDTGEQFRLTVCIPKGEHRNGL